MSDVIIDFQKAIQLHIALSETFYFYEHFCHSQKHGISEINGSSSI